MDGGLRIGEWRVDPARGEMTRGGETVRLEARTLRLIAVLAARRGEIVSIDQLLDEVWPEVTVSPDSVYQAVAALRRQLGDDPRRPRYIATAPRLGYRLIAETAPEPARRRAPRTAIIAVAAAFAGATGTALAMGVVQAAAPPPSVGVMPFLDTSPAADEFVLTDNLTEDVADGLARMQGLSTPGSRSSFALRRRGLTVPEAARKLGVDYMLDGSVRADPRTVQVTVRLIRADSGFVTWTRVYRTPRAGLDAVGRDITAQVAAVATGV